MKASLVKLSTSVMGNTFCVTSKEELAGRKAEEEHWREEGGCGITWKGKAAAEKRGRMLIQAGEQLGKRREVGKRGRQSWKISVHDIAVTWQNPHAGTVSVELSAQLCFLRWAGIGEIVEYEPNYVNIWHGMTKLCWWTGRENFIWVVGEKNQTQNQNTQSNGCCSKG